MGAGFVGRAATALALAAAAAGCMAAGKEATMDEGTFGKAARAYAGRFSLSLPVDVKPTGGENAMRRLQLREVALAGSPEAAWSAAWSAKLAEIATIKARRMRPGWIDGEIHSQVELAPPPDRFQVVLYHPDNVKVAVRFAALRQRGSAGLWLGRTGELEDRDDILKAIAALGNAWQPVAEGAPRPKGDVFHLPGGAVALPYAVGETAQARFVGGALGVEVKLSTESTPEPKGGGLMERFGGAVAKAGAAFAAGASPVRNRSRTAAGMSGEEFVMRDSEDGKLYFMWEFPGEARSGAKPRIQLQMITKDERQKEKMAFWDALVDSLRPAAAP